MRIAYISYEYPPDTSNGGIATYVAQASRMMFRRGHEVEVFASSPSRQGRYEVNGILEHRIREENPQHFGIVAGHAFAARHAEKPFDVLEGPEYNADARKAVELVPNMPLVVKLHTPSLMIATLNAPSEFKPYLRKFLHSLRVLAGDLVKRRPLRPFQFTLPYLQAAREIDQLEAAHARTAKIVAPPCQDLCAHAAKTWKIPADAIRLSPHPYTPAKPFLALQPKADGLTVGFVGRLEKRKGIETLAAAIPAILNAVPDAKFLFIGAAYSHSSSGLSYEEWIRRRLPQYQGRLEFFGKCPLERMPEAYDRLDVCAFPSLWENFPNVCLEAMAAGKAVVASAAGGMTEMLDHGRAGRLVPPGDPAALAREIISLLKQPSERIRLGQIARQRVLDTYNENVIGKMMEDIYQDAINQNVSRSASQSGGSH